MNLSDHNDQDIYHLWADVMNELERRSMLVNGSPLAWYAEQLVCDRLDLDPAPDNTPFYDAVAKNGDDKYQIKARRADIGDANINGITGVDEQKFKFLVVVLFRPDRRTISGAYDLHSTTVKQISTIMSNRPNAREFTLNSGVASRRDVHNITHLLT